MQLHRITREAIDVSFSLLELVDTSSDWFPPLKNAAASALRIAQLVKGFSSHKKDWGKFADHVQIAVACIVRLLPDASNSGNELKQGIVALRDSLQVIVKDIETRLVGTTWKHASMYIKAQKTIQEMRTKIDAALCVFPLGSMMATGLDVAKLLEGLDIQKHVDLVNAKLNKIVTSIEASDNTLASQIGGDVLMDTLINASRNPAVTSLPRRQAASFTTHDAFTVHNVNGNQYITNEYHGGGKSDITSKGRENLSRVPNAGFDRSKCCLGRTRKEIIDAISLWATFPNTPVAFWLCGLAGMGKTTIANSVAARLKQLGYLGGSFLFSRAVKARNKADQLFSTIAFQMCSNSTFAAELGVILSEDPDLAHPGLPLLTQYEELIERPLKAMGRDLDKPVVIVLDALDECGTERERESLLNIIISKQSHLSTRVKFFITSRPESDISTVLSSSSLIQTLDISTSHSNSVYADRDITTFVRDRMAATARLYRLSVSGEDQWPGRERRDFFVQKASGLFIWASTACEFIHNHDSNSPDARLDLILGHGSPDTSRNEQQWRALDILYLQVLQAAVAGNNSDTKAAQIREILGAIVVALDPLSSASLSSILALGSPNVIWQRLRKLQSVLTVPEDTRDLVRTIHLSFPDFLTNLDRCTDSRFHIEPSFHHALLAKQCLLHMQIPGKLRRDICGLGDAPRLNSAIDEQYIKDCIPADLQYACEFWAEHIHRSIGDVDALRSLVEKFLFEHLLHWLEVLSLLEKFDSAVALLRKVNAWIQLGNVSRSTEAPALLTDALLFVREFHAPIAASASQIYISALPFSPQSSTIFRTFSPRYGCKATVISGARQHWPSHVSIGCEEVMHQLAFSPDGNRVVCSSETVIYVYDLSVGGRVGLPLTGHSGCITSVAFCANGRHVLSVSKDGSLRLWDTRTNSQVDVVCHEDQRILQVVITRDGSTIYYISQGSSAASEGSEYNWSTEASAGSEVSTGSEASRSFDASMYADTILYNLFIMSISLAPGGGHFLHPSRTTKQLCQQKGSNLLDREPHRDITISSCGGYTATNYEDCIRVWDTKTGAAISQPLDNPKRVLFISFSPSGDWILCIAGSQRLDKADVTKVWDWRTGSIVHQFNPDYPRYIRPMVTFSSKGNKIFLASPPSGCDIRAWKFGEGCLVGEPWKGSSRIRAIASSPDGALLVSATDDKSLCVWDTHTTFVPEQQSLPEQTTRMPSSVELSIVDQPLRQTFSHSPASIILSPDGTRLATIVETSRNEYILRIAPWSHPDDTIDISASLEHGVSFSPDGSYIAFLLLDGSVGVWKSFTGVIITHKLLPESLSTRVFFSLDGRRIFGHYMQPLRWGWTWDIESGIFRNFRWELMAMSVSRSGHVLATGNHRGDVCLRNPETGILTGGPLKGHTERISSVAFSPDGTRLVSGSSDHTVRVWDAEKLISVGHPLKGHTYGVTSVSYSPDGKWIISNCKSRHVDERLVWDAHNLSPANLSKVDALSRRFVPGASFLRLKRDGWVVDLGDNPILWVPADTRRLRAAQRNSLAFDGLEGLRLVDVSDIAV